MVMYSVLRLQQGKFRDSISHLETVADFKSVVVDERCDYGWLQAATGLPDLCIGPRDPEAR